MSDLHLATVFIVLFSGHLTWSGTVAVRHHLALGEVGPARYTVIVRGFSIMWIALSPLLMNLMDGPVLVGMAMLWLALMPSILDPQWRRDEADRKRARHAHPAGTRPTSKPARTPSPSLATPSES